MDLYTVDSNFVQTGVVEGWTSLIWTERYNQYGDVTLVWTAGGPLDAVITEGVFLHTPASREIMLVDTISTEDGVTTATGQSLVGFLANRIFRDTWTTAAEAWLITDSAGDICASIMSIDCLAGGDMAAGSITPQDGADEAIPHLTNGPIATGSNITISIPYGQVYDAIKAVCDADNIGFSMYPPSITDGTGNMIFTTYRGLDRTTTQSTNEVVIFEPALDSLTDITELRSIAGYKTVAFAWASGMTSKANIGVAYASGGAGLTGFNRRTLFVDASDVTATDYTSADLKALLNQRARNALINNNYVRMTDGTVVPQSTNQYGVDYNLGDVIELRGPSDVAQKARITEYIRSQDATGELAYPTLSAIS